MAVDTEIKLEAVETGAPHSAEPPFLGRVRLRAQRRVLWMRSLWSKGQSESEMGLVISHSEIDRILADPAAAAGAEALFYATDEAARALADPIRESDELAAADAKWKRLREAFSLSEAEMNLLSLAVAAETDPLFRRVYGYLHDDATASYATPWLAAALFESSVGATLGPESGLVRWRLARPAEGVSNPWSVTTPWLADPYLMLWIANSSRLDPALGAAVTVIPASESQARIGLYPVELSRMHDFVEAVLPDAPVTPIELELVGAEGAGKQTLAGQYAASLGGNLVSADAGVLLSPDVPSAMAAERIVRAARMAQFSNSLLYWHNVDGVNPRVWESAQGYAGVMIFGSQTAMPQRTRGRTPRLTLEMPALTRSQRIALWQALSDLPAPEPVTDWMLMPAEIAAAAQVARAGAAAVSAACRSNLNRGPSELFSPLACPYTWDDIVLTPAVRQQLAELEQQARLRWPVYEDWGFNRLVPTGRGITAMFAGPSGTGKTMAAQVVARSLDMKLYRVDLAGVMNKYIGETEKRLKQVFEACERTNVVLFFDEADALFGQRTQVKDAHDRFANIEIDYLLQRMEHFDGVAILATNRKGDLDKSFLRRIRFIVDFLQPGPSERLALWKRALLTHSPAGDPLLGDINWEFLAGRLNMTGADITAAALGAAFLAHADGGRITMPHVLYAARREMAKHGVTLRTEGWEG